jgi:hypothetical protein
MSKESLLKAIGYMTERQALTENFSHHGKYYGIPVWLGDIEGDFLVATKWAPMELLMSVFHTIEGIIRPVIFPDEPNSFQFQIGSKIIIDK